ncbi:hypothetical protein AAG570_004929, partial [Ranatra chinensis]
TDVGETFNEEVIFVTGATGFLGKVLTEKLLRTCSGLKHIYLLARDKKGKSVEARIEEIFGDTLFSELERIDPKFRNKVTPICGDCSLPALGLSLQDRQLLIREVSVVFHGAATVRFDEQFRIAFNINVRGTKELLLLVQEMKSLKAFIHISTAYSNCNREVVEERLYESPIDFKKLELIVENLDDNLLDSLVPKLLGTWPNTYTYTKAIGEQVVKSLGQGMPISIFRPAIVVGTAEEPVIGWTDNVYGPTGIVVGAGCGVLHSIYGDTECNANLVPVDMAVSAIIVSAAEIIQENQGDDTDIPIYNYVSVADNPLKWKEFKHYLELHGDDIPTVKAMWCYFLTIHKNKFTHNLCCYLFHYFPALLVDIFARITNKNYPNMVNIYRKVDRYSEVMTYFSIRNWDFRNENMIRLWSRLNPDDKTRFNFDFKTLDWSKFFYNYIRGLRIYLLKDDMSTLPQARATWAKFKRAHSILKVGRQCWKKGGLSWYQTVKTIL